MTCNFKTHIIELNTTIKPTTSYVCSYVKNTRNVNKF